MGLKQPLTASQCRKTLRLITSLNMSGGRLSQALVIKQLCHLCLNNIVENHAQFVPKCPLYESIRDRFSPLLQNATLDTLNIPFSENDTKFL